MDISALFLPFPSSQEEDSPRGIMPLENNSKSNSCSYNT